MGRAAYGGSVLTIYGVSVLTFMMVMYAFERRDRRLMAFALGCALSSSYGFLIGAWPFGVVETIWCVIAATSRARRRPQHLKVHEGPLRDPPASGLRP
jgi:hypothetical protein